MAQKRNAGALAFAFVCGWLSLAILLSACGQTSSSVIQPSPQPPAAVPVIPPKEKPDGITEPTPLPKSVSVEISGFAFSPATITVARGTTVTWTNKDNVNHTVSSQNEVFDSGTVRPNGTFSHTFTETGTFNYFCKFHPSMTGTVILTVIVPE